MAMGRLVEGHHTEPRVEKWPDETGELRRIAAPPMGEYHRRPLSPAPDGELDVATAHAQALGVKPWRAWLRGRAPAARRTEQPGRPPVGRGWGNAAENSELHPEQSTQ